ncbi:hypothetical protein GQ600_14295 [Phytophthora cactorum]|nr:hypothetical protein GQ600_14295 [Phytophthora cactorum]
MELTCFGGDNWLSGTCIYWTSLRVAEEAIKLTWHKTTIVNVVDPIYMQMADEERRKGYLDTSDRVISRMEANRIVFCPVYINTAFPQWCGIIFDMERQITRLLDEVESTINSHFMPLMMTRMEIRTFPGLLQRDGHSCGVLVVHWFEMYLTIARTTSPDHSIPMPRGDKLDPKKLQYVRH